MPTFIAIIDIGKTHSKLTFVDAGTGKVSASHRHANASLDTSIGRQLDVAGIERWLIERLRSAPQTSEVAALVPIAHGATAVLLDAHGTVVAAPDYEDPRFESINDEYARQRDPFAATLSPSLPLGLNLARQLFYLQHATQAFERAAHILLYPQYWAWRFCGVLASEATSLGCHTDLWLPAQGEFSALARTNGWDRLLPPVRSAQSTLGTVSDAMAAATGLPRHCRVICGIHDSNASYLQHLIERPREEPFAVVSSGTWTVIMANRGNLDHLDERRDMLANVDAFGSPVPTARFMGGREYEAIAGRADAAATLDDVQAIVQRHAFAIPAFAPAGPFPEAQGRLIEASNLSDTQRQALASLYCALLSDLVLDALGASGEFLVDGPFGSNTLFLSLLASWRPHSRILSRSAGGACTRAAAYLAGFDIPAEDHYDIATASNVTGLDDYRLEWRNKLPAP